MAHPAPQSASQALGLTLTEHDALILDVYGTLIDWESAIHDAFAPVFPNLSRQAILTNYAEVEGRLQTQFQNTDYATLLERAYRQLATEGPPAPTPTPTSDVTEGADDAAARFGRSIPDWKPFPDTVDALHRLKKHVALVVLSNVDDQSFAHTHAALCSPHYPGSTTAFPTVHPDSPFALVLTAQQVGAYKPHPAMLDSALKQLSAHPDPLLPSDPSVRVDASRVLVVANSIRHDIIPAAQHGLRSVWISRHGVNVIGSESVAAGHPSPEGATAADDSHPYTWRYETLGSLADAVESKVPL